MKEMFFTFPGTHAAMAAEKALLAAGFAVRVMPLPDAVGAGCGLSTRVDAADAADAAKVLREGGVPFEGAYGIDKQSGKVEYPPWPL